MAEIEKKPVKVVETSLRDAHPVSDTHLYVHFISKRGGIENAHNLHT